MTETSAVQTTKKVDELLAIQLGFGTGNLGAVYVRRFRSLVEEHDRFEAALRAIVDGGHRVKARAIARAALGTNDALPQPTRARQLRSISNA